MELLVVIAIAGMIGGVLAINIGATLRSERFRAGADALAHTLRVAQELMLVYDTCVTVHLRQEEDRIFCRLDFEETLKGPLNSGLKKEHRVKGVRSFVFVTEEGSSQDKEIRLNFLSGGSVMSRGLLYLSPSPSRDADELAIVLAGYPKPIEIKTNPSLPDKQEEGHEELYPKEVAQR